MPIRAGDLNRRVTIERSTPVDDGHATRPGPFQPVATVWAQYMPGRGSERRELASQRAEQPVTFRVRYSALMTTVGPKDRLRYPAPDGPVHEIVAPLVEYGRREGLDIMCIVSPDA